MADFTPPPRLNGQQDILAYLAGSTDQVVSCAQEWWIVPSKLGDSPWGEEP